MKITEMVNIIKDNLSDSSLKGMYWNTSKSLHRYKQLTKKNNHVFAGVVLNDYKRFLFNTVKPISGENEQRMKAAVDWLIYAKKFSNDNGVSVGYFPCQTMYDSPWFPSYPETTGYIIQSLIEYSEKYDDQVILEHALSMAKWESEVQMPSGAV